MLFFFSHRDFKISYCDSISRVIIKRKKKIIYLPHQSIKTHILFNLRYYNYSVLSNIVKEKVGTPQLNHISMKMPTFPLMSQPELINENSFCNSSTVQGCQNDYCSCSHVLQVKLGSVVELVLVDEGNLILLLYELDKKIFYEYRKIITIYIYI